MSFSPEDEVKKGLNTPTKHATYKPGLPERHCYVSHGSRGAQGDIRGGAQLKHFMSSCSEGTGGHWWALGPSRYCLACTRLSAQVLQRGNLGFMLM